MIRTQRFRQIAVGTPLGEDVLLLKGLTGTESLGRPFEYNLDLLSEDPNIGFDDIVGQDVSVRVQRSSGEEPTHFNGFVSSFAFVEPMHGLSRYRAIMVPWLWFMTQTSDCRIFQNLTVPDVIKKVFRGRGFTDFEDRLSEKYRTWEYCVQYRETDFNFVSRLMEQEGIYYYFRHEESKHTLVLADSAAAHEPIGGYETIPYRPHTTSLRQEEYVSKWAVEQNVQPGAYAHNDFDFKNPTKPLLAASKSTQRNPLSGSEIFDYPGKYVEVGDGEDYARRRIEELHARHEVATGEGEVRGIAAGCTFTLTGHPRASLCKKYLVTQTTVEASSDHFGSQGGAAPAGGTYVGDGEGENYLCRVTAIDATQPFRTPRTTPRPEIRGPQTAVVVGPKGEEIYTDEFGRVKVMFHWDRYSPGDENSSCWIRVAQAWAGRKWGAIYIPRVGQEVIVEFLEADPDQPIITGRVYNGRSTPPYTLPDQKTMSTMKSNSTKGGDGFNEIRFEDKKGGEQIFIHSQKRMDVRVRDSYYETNYGNRETRVGWEKDGDKGGDHNTLVHNDVNAHVEGGEFRHVEKQLNQTVDQDVVENHKKNHTTVVTDRSSLNAKELVVETSDLISQKTKKVTVDGSQEIDARGGKVNVEATQQINLKAMQVNIEGTTGVSIKVGGSFVSLSPAGVFVSGTIVGLNSGGSAQSAGSASAATSFEKADIELPFDAAVADDGKPGNVGSTSGRARTREKVTLTPQKAPAYVPPPPPPPAASALAGSQAAIVKPPQKQASNGACCQCELTLTCEHNREAINDLLQVVPDPKKAVRAELSLGPITASSVGGFSPDTVTVTLKQTKDKGSTCMCKPQIVVSGAGNERTNSSVLNLLANPPSSEPFWPFQAQPRVYNVSVEGCQNPPRPCAVECFPPAQVELDIDLKKLKEYFDAFEKGLKGIYELLEGEEPDYKYLLGSITGTWGWKEGADNRAYFEADVTAYFQPLISFDGVQLKCSVANYVPVFIREHIADIYAYLQFDGSIDGNLHWKTNGPVVSGSKGWDCGGELDISVTVSLGIEATAGAKDIVGIKVGACIKATFNGKIEAVFDPSNGFGIDPEITWDGLSGEVYAEVKGSGWFGWVDEDVSAKTVFVKGGDIWNPPAFYPFK